MLQSMAVAGSISSIAYAATAAGRHPSIREDFFSKSKAFCDRVSLKDDVTLESIKLTQKTSNMCCSDSTNQRLIANSFAGNQSKSATALSRKRAEKRSVAMINNMLFAVESWLKHGKFGFKHPAYPTRLRSTGSTEHRCMFAYDSIAASVFDIRAILDLRPICRSWRVGCSAAH